MPVELYHGSKHDISGAFLEAGAPWLPVDISAKGHPTVGKNTGNSPGDIGFHNFTTTRADFAAAYALRDHFGVASIFPHPESGIPIAVGFTDPGAGKKGYIYRFTVDEHEGQFVHRAFDDGKPTGEWTSHIAAPIDGKATLRLPDDVMKCGVQLIIIPQISQNAYNAEITRRLPGDFERLSLPERRGKLMSIRTSYLKELMADGKVRHLNQEYGICPYDFLANRFIQEPDFKPDFACPVEYSKRIADILEGRNLKNPDPYTKAR